MAEQEPPERRSGERRASQVNQVPMHEALLAAVAQQVSLAAKNAEELTTAARDLRDSYRLSRRMKVTLAVGGVLIGLMAFAIAGLVVLAITNRTLLHDVDSCTTPKGLCYERGQSQTAQAVATIIATQTRVDLAVVVCSGSPSVQSALTANNDDAYSAALTRCVNKRLAGK